MRRPPRPKTLLPARPRIAGRLAGGLVAALLALPAPAQDLAGHGGPVRALALLDTAAPRLASAGFDHAVILWDPIAGRALRVLRWHAGAVAALLPLPGGGLASAGEDGRIAVWPAPLAPGDAPARVLEGHGAPVAGLARLEPGLIASAGWDGTVRLWAEAGGAAEVLSGHAGPVNAVAVLPGAAPRLVSAGHDGTLRLWEQAAGGAGWQGRVLAAFGVPQNALASLPGDPPMVAAAGADGTIRLVSAAGVQRELAAGTRPLVALAVAPDGHLLAAAGLGGAVTLWSLPDGRLRHTLQGPGQPFWSVAFSGDGASLWTGGQDRRVRRWSVATGTALGPLAGAIEEPAGPAAAAALAEPHGARVFRACAACHALTEEAGPPMAGPHLHGLFGRRMGSVAGYAYSPRLARGDVTWTRETVADLFTRGPDVVVPGTKMPVQTVGEASDLAALLRFLETATR